MTGLRQRIAFSAVLGCLPFALVILIEGTASMALFVRKVRHEGTAEEIHAERDTLVGWINKPDFVAPDMYAPGVGLRTNRQRFRHDGDVAPVPPQGTRRLICSGDSFTLGYGVDDAHTWCALLGLGDPSLETVNMGQGGYGLDQAYLWYLRDGLLLRPRVHVFAYNTVDLHRMRLDRINGYPKPQLVRAGDGVRVTGVPLPRAGLGPAFAKLEISFRTLRMFELVSLVFGNRQWSDPSPRDSATWDVASATLGDLARRDRAAGAELLVIYLPILDDYSKPTADRWRQWARTAAARGEFRFVDLIDPFRKVPPDSVNTLFIAPDVIRFKGAAGHYTVAGNVWVAEQLRRLLRGPG